MYPSKGLSLFVGGLLLVLAPFSESAVLFEDDFNDGQLNTALWNTSGSYVQETAGLLRLVQNATDNGGVASTIDFGFDPTGGTVTWTMSTRVHYQNNYFRPYQGLINRTSDGQTQGLAAVRHRHYFYHTSDNYFGIDGASQTLSPIWDQWFTETVTYEPTTGDLLYSVDDGNTVQSVGTVGSLPDTSTLYLYLQTYGWFTGAYTEYDWVRVEQDSSGGGVVSTPGAFWLLLAGLPMMVLRRSKCAMSHLQA